MHDGDPLRPAARRAVGGGRLEHFGLAIPIAVVVIMASSRRWTSEFGFRYFRVVDQLLSGNGPVLNDGERVEAVSSPLWTAILAIADTLSPLRIEFTALVLSIACMAVAMGLTTAASVSFARSSAPGTRLVPLGSATFAALWPVWVWSSGGSETALVCLWYSLAFWTMSKWAGEPRRQGSRLSASPTVLVVCGAGWVVRPELAPTSALFVALLIWAGNWRGRAWSLVVATALPAAYQLFRMGYYGLLVPVNAVSRDVGVLRPADGWSFVWNFVGPYALVAPVGAIALGALAPLTLGARVADRPRRARAVALAVTVGGLLQAVSLVAVGGDYVHARLLVPPLFAVLAPCFVVPLTRRLAVPIIVTAAWTPLCLFLLRTDGRSQSVAGTLYTGAGHVTHEDFGWPIRGARQNGYVGPGLYRAELGGTDLEPLFISISDGGTAVATPTPGLVGYALGTDVAIVDLSGSLEPTVAHLDQRAGQLGGFTPNVPSAWILSSLTESATAVLPGLLDTSTPGYDDPTGLAGTESAAWAERAFSCGGLAQLSASYREPLAAGDFVSNILDSFGNTMLRFPELPEAAAFQLCGADTPVSIGQLLQPSRGSRLDVTAAAGTVAVPGRCDMVTVVDQLGRWRVDHAARWRAMIDPQPGSTAALDIVVFTFGPFDANGATSTVVVETDGNGRARVTVTTDFFGTATGSWVAPGDAPLEVVASPDLLAQTWEVVMGSEVVARLPMTSVIGDDVFAIVADRVNEGVTYESSVPPPACQRMIRFIS